MKANTELCRISSSFAGVGGVAHKPAFREGQEDEYEAMVNLKTLDWFGYELTESAKIMPAVVRCFRGLSAPSALPIQNSGNGIMCCDLDKLREHLHRELGVVLVKGNREGIPFALQVPISLSDSDDDDDGDDDDEVDVHTETQNMTCYMLEDPALILRILTAYRNHNASSLPLFLDYPIVPADAAPELVKLFECSICLEMMNDPSSLGCGHSACLRYVLSTVIFQLFTQRLILFIKPQHV